MKYKVIAIRKTDGTRMTLAYCPVCDTEIGFEPFCENCGDVSGCESKYYCKGITIK